MKSVVLSFVFLLNLNVSAQTSAQPNSLPVSVPKAAAPVTPVTEKGHCADELKEAGKPGQCAPIANANAKADQFGAPIKAQNPISIDAALERFKKDKVTTMLVEAKVDKVCLKKGCWMALKSKTTDVRVTFKDYGFFVPISLVGKTVWVEGAMAEKKLSLEQTKHYVEDEGGDPSKVTEARTDYQFVASGVLVKN